MTAVAWERYPVVAAYAHGRVWLQIIADEQKAPATIDAYGRALNDYLAVCEREHTDPLTATRADIARFISAMADRSLKKSTQRQRYTAVSLFYDYLIEESIRSTNPAGRRRWGAGGGIQARSGRSMIPRIQDLPWIPTDAQWRLILEAARQEPLRNRLMFALAYDAALRREELCALAITDIDPAYRQIHIRAETTKSQRGRSVLFSDPTSDLYVAYLRHRRTLNTTPGPLFLSESPRNYGQPISKWTWSKVVEEIADRAGVEGFSTHTLRHLCLTDLARDEWEILQIAEFAGHQRIDTTRIYIHLSGRDLAKKLARTMQSIHAWRAQLTGDQLS